jgi:hypothetical protein
MLHSAEPGKIPKESIAERCFKPGEVSPVRSPISVIGLMPLLTEEPPNFLSLGQLDASPHKIASLRRKGQVLATGGCRGFAKWTMPLIDHGLAASSYRYLAAAMFVKEKSHTIVTLSLGSEDRLRAPVDG